MPNTYIERFNSYITNVQKGKISVCKFVKQSTKRHLDDLKASKKGVLPYHFDEKKASKVCKFIESLTHVKGPKAGENIYLEPWQCFIVCSTFGWVDDKGYRRFNQVYIEVPRGNGKSSLSSGIALYMLCADGEQGADVYSFATTREQARIVFNDALAMARGNKALRDAFHLECLNNSMFVIPTNSKFLPKSSDAQTLDGLNTHCGIVDELHAHKTREVFDVVKTSIGKRSQPLMFCITTAGFNLSGVCMEQRRTVQKILDKSATDDNYFGIIYTIDEDDDWKNEDALIKANPNWGVSVIPKIVRGTLTNALINASAEKTYLTKHLNVWCNADTQWLQMDKYRRCVRPEMKLEDFYGYNCIYGIDLATKIDITAIVRLFWKKEKDVVHYYVFPTFFLPSERIESANNSQYLGWLRDGLLEVTDGPVTDLDYIQQYIINDSRQFNTLQIGFDPWQASQMAQNLAMNGAPMIEVTPSVFNFSEPMKTIEALVYSNRLHTDGNPILMWMFSNVVCHRDAKDNIYPRKEQNENKIDGVVALLTAFNLAVKNDVEVNYLENGGDDTTDYSLVF